MIWYGVIYVFVFKESELIDEDIIIILERGEKKIVEMNECL